jgi:hypothetical protein
MITNCQFILENKEFDYIDDELINGQLQCSFSYYNYGEGCLNCPVYKQLMESTNKTEYNDFEEYDILF